MRLCHLRGWDGSGKGRSGQGTGGPEDGQALSSWGGLSSVPSVRGSPHPHRNPRVRSFLVLPPDADAGSQGSGPRSQSE